MASQRASPLPRGQPSQVRSPDCGRSPQLRTWRQMVGEWGRWGMTAWSTGSQAMGSTKPEALFLSSSTSRYGSAGFPGKVQSGDSGVWHRRRGGSQVTSVGDNSVWGPTVTVSDPHQGAGTHTPTHIRAQACARMRPHMPTPRQPGSLRVQPCPCAAVRLGSRGATRIPALVRLPCDPLYHVQEGGWGRKWGGARACSQHMRLLVLL